MHAFVGAEHRTEIAPQELAAPGQPPVYQLAHEFLRRGHRGRGQGHLGSQHVFNKGEVTDASCSATTDSSLYRIGLEHRL